MLNSRKTLTERRFGFFAVAAIMATRKRTIRAAKRCRKRMARAMVKMEEQAADDPTAAALAVGAKTLVQRNCRMCQACEGV